MVIEKTVVIAAGGTGGHLFPAQALANELQLKGQRLLFAGANLSSNRYFDRVRYPFAEVLSLSPFSEKKSLIKAPWVLGMGVAQSLRILSKEKADLVVGFGSFHSFPLLVAARLKKIPLILFEPNAIPGKVNRLFSKGALFTAILFDEVEKLVQGEVQRVAPLVRPFEEVTREKALNYFSLDRGRSTLLIFGGSQGARSINALFKESADHFLAWGQSWQILHFTGSDGESSALEDLYKKAGITARVKPFEKKMECAWKIADLVVSRSGASTISEQLFFSVPALFIPYPYATDDHQALNAAAIERCGGAVLLRESEATGGALFDHLGPLLNLETGKLKAMHLSLKAVKENQNQQHLCENILNHLRS